MCQYCRHTFRLRKTLHRRLCALACVREVQRHLRNLLQASLLSSPTGAEDLGGLDGSQVLFPQLALDCPVPVTPHKTQQQKDPLNRGTQTAIRAFERLDTKNADIKTAVHHSTKLAASLRPHTWLSLTVRSLLSASARTVQFDIPFQKNDAIT